MELKRYQERVVREVDAFLQALARLKGERFPSQAAWEEAGLPGQYHPRKNGVGKDLPTFCIKVPTGGGKTLLATQISGKELLDEEMIKLPMNIANKNQRDWRDVVTAAKDRREELAKKAAVHYDTTEQLIRPIVLVQVERTGKDQRESGYIHSDQVKDYLMQRLGVKEDAIAIKTSERDDLEGRGDLLDEDCPVEWIITKAALQEGWDCPFAYILVVLRVIATGRGGERYQRHPARQRPFRML